MHTDWHGGGSSECKIRIFYICENVRRPFVKVWTSPSCCLLWWTLSNKQRWKKNLVNAYIFIRLLILPCLLFLFTCLFVCLYVCLSWMTHETWPPPSRCQRHCLPPLWHLESSPDVARCPLAGRVLLFEYHSSRTVSTTLFSNGISFLKTPGQSFCKTQFLTFWICWVIFQCYH